MPLTYFENVGCGENHLQTQSYLWLNLHWTHSDSNILMTKLHNLKKLTVNETEEYKYSDEYNFYT